MFCVLCVAIMHVLMIIARKNHRQQNKCYPKGVYLLISKLHSILAVVNLLAHNNENQIYECSQIS